MYIDINGQIQIEISFFGELNKSQRNKILVITVYVTKVFIPDSTTLYIFYSL